MTANEFHLKDRGQRIMLRTIAIACLTAVLLGLICFAAFFEGPAGWGLLIAMAPGYLVAVHKLTQMPGVVYTNLKEDDEDDDDDDDDDEGEPQPAPTGPPEHSLAA